MMALEGTRRPNDGIDRKELDLHRHVCVEPLDDHAVESKKTHGLLVLGPEDVRVRQPAFATGHESVMDRHRPRANTTRPPEAPWDASLRNGRRVGGPLQLLDEHRLSPRRSRGK